MIKFVKQVKKFLPKVKMIKTDQNKTIYMSLSSGTLSLYYTNAILVCKTTVGARGIEGYYKVPISILDSALKNFKDISSIELDEEKIIFEDSKGNKEVAIIGPATCEDFSYFSSFIGNTEHLKEIHEVDTILWKTIALATTEKLGSNFSYVCLDKDMLFGLDGHRVHYKKGILSNIEDDRVYYIYGSIIRGLQEKKYILCDINENTMSLACPYNTIYFKKHHGFYCKWEKHINNEASFIVAVDTVELVNSIKQLVKTVNIKGENRLFLDFNNEELRTYAGEVVPFKFGVVKNEEPLSQTLLNYNFLLDALQCGGKAMDIKMRGRRDGVIICGSICNACIMPVI